MPVRARALWIVLAINAAFFVLETLAGNFSGSLALRADALDFLADSFVYAAALSLIRHPAIERGCGIILSLLAGWILVRAELAAAHGMPLPDARIMAGMALAAMAANAASLHFLRGAHAGQAVWRASRDDFYGNALVLVAALAILIAGAAWADPAAAGVMAAVFLARAVRLVFPGNA